MKNFNLFLLFFVVNVFQDLVIADQTVKKPCKKKSYGHDSFVCVCSSNYCDTVEPLGDVSGDKMAYFITDKLAHRLAKFEKDAEKNDGNAAAYGQNANTEFEVRVDASKKRQRIVGFGGAFTDSAGVNLNALSKQSREALMKSYFDPKIGIGYSVGRVPIASCDFSTREYSYVDKPDDFNLTTFKLAKEDFEDKIPYILKAIQLSGGSLRLFASPWSPPGWMKMSGKMVGAAKIKGTLDGPYYRAYAQYFKRFFEEYAKRNVHFWGVTIENEPFAEFFANLTWQGLFIDSKTQSDFASQLLVPALQSSKVTKNLLVMGHDDQRHTIDKESKDLFYNPNQRSAIDGIAVHWYAHSPYKTLDITHNLFPDKFVLATEACTGFFNWEHSPLLGDWIRGWSYGHDILNQLRNWVVGWTDWNLCLDLLGGPNWVGNLVDAPILVNASADEFYKQPMFYFMAHFSKFVPQDSVVISSTLLDKNGKILADNPVENAYAFENFTKLNCEILSEKQQIEHIAFLTPEGKHVLVLINEHANARNISVADGQQRWTVPMSAESIVTAIWTPWPNGKSDALAKGEGTAKVPSKDFKKF